jgi:DNA repair exonuclease SbcCD ATPase subunit
VPKCGKKIKMLSKYYNHRASLVSFRPRMASRPLRAVPSTSKSFEEEIAARTAAMENLQQQLIRVENLRADELKTAISRFEELEEALLMAEKSILAEEGRVNALEMQLEQKDKELEALRKQYNDIPKQNNDHIVQELERKLEIAMKQIHESNLLAEKATAREEEIRSAAKKELEASQKLVEMANEMLSQLSMPSDTEDPREEQEEVEAVLAELDLLRKELETELSVPGVKVVPMLDPSQMDTLRSQLNQAHKDLSASRSEEARLAIMLEKVQAELEEAKRQAEGSSGVIDKSSQRNYVKDLEERNRELVGQVKTNNKAMEESKRLLSLLKDEYNDKFKFIQ